MTSLREATETALHVGARVRWQFQWLPSWATRWTVGIVLDDKIDWHNPQGRMTTKWPVANQVEILRADHPLPEDLAEGREVIIRESGSKVTVIANHMNQRVAKAAPIQCDNGGMYAPDDLAVPETGAGMPEVRVPGTMDDYMQLKRTPDQALAELAKQIDRPMDWPMLPLSAITVKSNVRKRFDPVKLEELAASIRQHGVIEPIVVNRIDGLRELVAGERRYRASLLAGKTDIPYREIQVSRQEALELQLLENLQREDLDPMEEAEAYRLLMQEGHYTQTALADKLGVSQGLIANRLRLLRLPTTTQDLIAEGKLRAAHGWALLRLLPDPADMDKLPPGVPEIPELYWQVQEHFAAGKIPTSRAAEVVDAAMVAAVPLTGPVASGEQLPGWDVQTRCLASGCPHAVHITLAGQTAHRCMHAPHAQLLAAQEVPGASTEIQQPEGAAGSAPQATGNAPEPTGQAAAQETAGEPKPHARAPLPLPTVDLRQAEAMADIGRETWERWRAGWDTVYERESLLELSQLLTHWRRRSDMSSPGLPLQMAAGIRICCPEQRWTAYATESHGAEWLDLTEGLRINVSGFELADDWPTGPVYYRVGLSDRSCDALGLEQLVVIPLRTRTLVIGGSDCLTMQPEDLPPWADLLESLPAHPLARAPMTNAS